MRRFLLACTVFIASCLLCAAPPSRQDARWQALAVVFALVENYHLAMGCLPKPEDIAAAIAEGKKRGCIPGNARYAWILTKGKSPLASVKVTDQTNGFPTMSEEFDLDVRDPRTVWRVRSIQQPWSAESLLVRTEANLSHLIASMAYDHYYSKGSAPHVLSDLKGDANFRKFISAGGKGLFSFHVSPRDNTLYVRSLRTGTRYCYSLRKWAYGTQVIIIKK